MSPPCVATLFEGDNGGATSRGVTASEIRVGIPVRGLEQLFMAPVDALFEYFNQRFEFYGRRLVPVYVVGTASNALGARANAAEVAAQGVFAAMTGAQEWQVSQPALPAELARQKVVTVVRGATTWWTDRSLYDALHPFVWSVYPSAEDTLTNLGAFSCASLAGHLSLHAGDAALRSKTRAFGVLSLGQEIPPSTSLLRSALSDCTDVDPAHVEWVSSNAPAGSLRAGLERLRSAGVTTVICTCEGLLTNTAMTEANAMGFYPEWLFTPTYLSTGNDEHWLQPLRAKGQVAPPLRLDAGPRLLPVQARPWWAALQPLSERSPAPVSPGSLVAMGEFLYSQLLVLASGIQGAGPALTPDTFAQALMTMQFANPGAGQQPYWQPSIGFGPGDHSFYDDYQVAWWSDTAEALDIRNSPNPQGSWCYLDRAARFRPGAYPTDADNRLFNVDLPCR